MKEKNVKLLPLLCASFVALAALTLTAEVSSAAPHFSVNTSRFDPYKLMANDPKGETDCTGKGGKVITDKGGNKMCTMLEDAGPAKATNLHFHGTHTPPTEAAEVQDNAVADTGKRPADCAKDKDKGSATGGAGDGKAKAHGGQYNDCANKAVRVPAEADKNQ